MAKVQFFDYYAVAFVGVCAAGKTDTSEFNIKMKQSSRGNTP